MNMRFLTLDATGTLFRPRGSVGATYIAHWQRVACAEASVSSSAVISADLRDSYERHITSRFPAAYSHHMRVSPNFGRPPTLTTTSTAAPWWSRVILDSLPEDLVHTLSPDGQRELTTSLYQYFATGDAWRVFDDVHATLTMLHTHEIPMAVISDFDERLPRILDDLALRQYFSVVTTSWDIGTTKPAPIAFTHTFQALASSIGSTLDQVNGPGSFTHVGDHVRRDYQGARAIGANARLLDRQGSSSSNENQVPPEHVVSTLDDVLPLIL